MVIALYRQHIFWIFSSTVQCYQRLPGIRTMALLVRGQSSHTSISVVYDTARGAISDFRLL
jgi:hypothetical protein